MARRKIIAGNWKMNMTPTEAVELINTLKPLVATDDADVVFCVPAIDIIPAMEAAKGSNIAIGAENMYFEEKGAFTGEISPAMLTDAGVKYVVLGHSERREYFAVNIYPAEEHTLKRFTIRLAANEDYHTSITYDAQLGTVCFDRTHSGFRYNIITKREAPVRDQKGKISLRILMDRFSIEVFINNGEQVMSSTVYTPQEADGIFFEADGNGYFDVEKYELSL